MTKTKILKRIKEATTVSPFITKTLFYINGEPNWADRWLFPGELESHRGEIVQFYLTDDPKPEQIKNADFIPVDTWWQAGELARATLNKEPFEIKTSFGFVLKTLQADDQAPQFLSVHYEDLAEAPQLGDLAEYSDFLREESDIEENE